MRVSVPPTSIGITSPRHRAGAERLTPNAAQAHAIATGKRRVTENNSRVTVITGTHLASIQCPS